MSLTLLIIALQAAQTATPPEATIEVGRANWEGFQRLNSRLPLPTERMVVEVQNILRSRQCPSINQSINHFDITVNFAVRFDEANRPLRIVVEEMGCRPLESLVGGAVRDIIRHRFVDLPNTGAARWYGNSINFNLDS
ncbi:MAG: hypothetical protein ACK4SZ_03300 [Allosphingosinicella sp.]|uniref:hypothetical protein n=1 Tax=Allosphingosinicella sp. TaxID=2823234 RepID=UPI00395FAD68